MNSLWNILIYPTFILVFTFIYSLLWGFTRENFKSYKRYYHIFVGFLFCIMSILSSFILGIYNTKNNYSELLYYVPFIIFFISLNFISIITGGLVFVTNIIMSMKVYVVSSYINVSFDYNFKYFILFLYILVFILKIINACWNKIHISKAEFNFITIFLILVSFLVFRYVIYNKNSIKAFNSLVFILFLYFSNFLCLLVEQIFNHAIKLQNIVKYEDSYYLNSEYINFTAMKFLKKNKTKIGFYVSFFIVDYDDFDALLPTKIKQSIISNISDSFYNSINQSISNEKIFFKNNRKTYGTFIDVSENFLNQSIINENIILKSEIINKVNDAINMVSTRFKIDEFNIKINIAAVISLYGIQSNDFDELYAINDWFIRREKKLLNKKILLTNIEDYVNQKRAVRNIMILNENININAFNINYDPIYNISKKKFIGYISRTIIAGENIDLNTKNELYRKIEKISMGSTFTRYIAYKQLASLNKNTVDGVLYFINYDSVFISSKDFDISEFVKKIKFNNVKPSHIVLCLNINNEVSEIDILEQNIIELKKIGFKICVSDFQIINTDFSLIGFYRPDYIFVNFSNLFYMNVKQRNEFVLTFNYLSKKINCKIVYTGVRKYTDFIWLREHKVNYISGEIIGVNLKNNAELSEDLKYLLQKV